MSGVENLAKFGLFLTLAFAIPGMIYVGFMAIYFEDYTKIYLEGKTFVDVIGLSLFLGFLLTSLCLSIEKRVLWPVIDHVKVQSWAQDRKWFQWEKPDFPKIGEFEARGLNTFYLNQVLGQYACHLNVSIGVGLLLLLYWGFPQTNGISLGRSLIGVIIVVVNGYLALCVFRKMSIDTIEKYQEVVNTRAPN